MVHTKAASSVKKPALTKAPPNELFRVDECACPPASHIPESVRGDAAIGEGEESEKEMRRIPRRWNEFGTILFKNRVSEIRRRSADVDKSESVLFPSPPGSTSPASETKLRPIMRLAMNFLRNVHLISTAQMFCDRIPTVHANVSTVNVRVFSPRMPNLNECIEPDLHHDGLGMAGMSRNSPSDVHRCLLGRDLWPSPTGIHVYQQQMAECHPVIIRHLTGVRHICRLR